MNLVTLVTLKTNDYELLGMMSKYSLKNDVLEFVMTINLTLFTIKQYNLIAEDIISGICSFDIACKSGICSTDGRVEAYKYDKKQDTMTLNVRVCGWVVGEIQARKQSLEINIKGDYMFNENDLKGLFGDL